MPQRIIQILAPQGQEDIIDKIIRRAEDYHVIDYWKDEVRGDRTGYAFLVESQFSQPMIDVLQPLLDASTEARILVLPVEASLPKTDNDDVPKSKEQVKFSGIGRISREELHNQVAKGAKIDINYILLVIFSTIAATVGLLDDNVAVIIGAMVIAPFLGPNLALSFGSVLGDTDLVWDSLKASVIGVALTLVISIAIGFFWPHELNSTELLSRTEVSYSSAVLALAAGAAAVLSMTTGVSSVLVGVMVAVALLPPATTVGIMIGAAEFSKAFGAFILLSVNIISVNIAGMLVFIGKGVTPRTWYEKERAKRAFMRSLLIWGGLLVLAIGVIALRKNLG